MFWYTFAVTLNPNDLPINLLCAGLEIIWPQSSLWKVKTLPAYFGLTMTSIWTSVDYFPPKDWMPKKISGRCWVNETILALWSAVLLKFVSVTSFLALLNRADPRHFTHQQAAHYWKAAMCTLAHEVENITSISPHSWWGKIQWLHCNNQPFAIS